MYKVTCLLNIRAKANLNGKILGKLRKGDEVEIVNETSGFGKLKGRPGFVKMEFLEEIEEKAE